MNSKCARGGGADQPQAGQTADPGMNGVPQAPQIPYCPVGRGGARRERAAATATAMVAARTARMRSGTQIGVAAADDAS